MPDGKFTLKESDRIINDIVDEFFDQHNMDFIQKEGFKAGLFGGNEPIEEEVI